MTTKNHILTACLLCALSLPAVAEDPPPSLLFHGAGHSLFIVTLGSDFIQGDKLRSLVEAMNEDGHAVRSALHVAAGRTTSRKAVQFHILSGEFWNAPAGLLTISGKQGLLSHEHQFEILSACMKDEDFLTQARAVIESSTNPASLETMKK